jgi:ribosomal protein S6--L-glutamate ligase
MPSREKTYIALGSRLRGIPEVTTLGVKPNFFDYTQTERALILNARRIFFPTRNYAEFFSTMGKETFPSLENYLYADEKIKQTTLFYLLGIPHPRTKIYYRLHHQDITEDFVFPFVGKVARRSARGRGVFKLRSMKDLEDYSKRNKVAYIQEYLHHERDLRVVLINYEPVLAYWRIRSKDDFRTNVSQGGRIDFRDISEKGVELAREWAKACKFDDVGMDLINSGGKWYAIEANMKYGRKGLLLKGMDLKQIFRAKLLSGKLS